MDKSGSNNSPLNLGKSIFILGSMIVASLSLGFVVWASFGMPLTFAALAALGAVTFQFMGFVMVTAAQTFKNLHQRINDLTLSEAMNGNGVERLSNEMKGMRKALKTAVQGEVEPLARELEVIGTLIKQLAENSADSEYRITELEEATRDVTDGQNSLTGARADQPLPSSSAGQEREPSSKPNAEEKDMSWAEAIAEGRGEASTSETEYPAHSSSFGSGPASGPGVSKHPLPPVQSRRHTDIPADSSMMQAVRAAVDKNRVDLFLQPIVTLPQRKPKFYEALSRIRDSDGALIRPAQYLRSAEHAGAMPILDKMLLIRAVQVLQRLMARKADAVIVCNISATSLADTRFFNDFKMLLKAKRDLAEHLIFEFNQNTVEAFGDIEDESLRALKELGFKFAMDNVTRLAIDYPRLVDLGFHYIKTSATVLLEARKTGGNDIHAQDMPRFLARNGIEMIVDHIETEGQVIELLEFDVKYGQGFLFAAPREVKPDAILGATIAAEPPRKVG